MYSKINEILNKIAEWSGMSKEQKDEFFVNLSNGLILNLIKDGQSVVSETTLSELKNKPSDENFKKYFEELNQSPEDASKIFTDKIFEVLESVLNPIIPRLTLTQKQEILTILES